MKRHSLMIFAALAVLVFSSFTAMAGEPDPLFPVRINGKYGYIDKTGNIVIKPQFDGAGGFNDGLAPIKVGDKWGYINTTGKIAIKPQYKFAWVFSEGLAVVQNQITEWGYIDKTGKIVIELKCLYAFDFSNGLALINLNDLESAYIDKNGKTVFVFENDNPELLNHEFEILDVMPEPLWVEEITKDEEPIREISDEDPVFPGGVEALYKFLGRNLHYPELARSNNIEGTVVVKFVVEKDGSISNVKVIRDIGGGCGKEAVRLVNAMPKWTPGKWNGKPARCYYTLPVQFELNQDNETEQQY
ncbi:MAG: TonB family protein [Bacteroidales bacterium]|nr:TonB family protein [Bacteroidales bacterium]